MALVGAAVDGGGDDPLTPQVRPRATAVAGTIRTDGATVAATQLPNAISRGKPPAACAAGKAHVEGKDYFMQDCDVDFRHS